MATYSNNWDDLMRQATAALHTPLNNGEMPNADNYSANIDGIGATQVYTRPLPGSGYAAADGGYAPYATVFNYKDPNGPEGYMSQLYRKDDGTVGHTYYKEDNTAPWAAIAMMAAPFAAGLGAFGAGAGETAGWTSGFDLAGGASLPTGLDATAATAGAGGAAGWTSGYDLASGSALPSGGGGIWGTGLSTGSQFGDWLAKQGITTGIKSAIIPSLFGSTTGGNKSGTTGGSNMFGNSLADLLLSGYVSNNNIDRITDVANSSADRISGIANQIKDQGKFTPYNIRSGIGSVTTGPDGSIQTSLDPRYQANSDLALDKSNYWLNQKANPLYAQNETKGLFGAGQLMDKASAFDPESAAKTQYDLMQQIYAPTREKDNLDMENRLLQQGRLGLNYGSYGAAPELLALKEAQRQQDLNATLQSRSTAFDRQNQLLSQANTMNNMGIQAGQAGTNQQQAYFNMGNGLLNMSLKPQEMLQQQVGQAISAGSARANAEHSNASLFGNLALNAEKTRNQGAEWAAALKNQRDANMLKGVTGGAGGGSNGGLLGNLINGAGGAISSLAQQLLSSGVPPESLSQVMSDMGVNIDQGMNYEDFGANLDNLQFSDSGSDLADLLDF